MFKLALLLLCAQYSGDFLVYSTRLSSGKRTDDLPVRLRALFLHCLIHLGWVLVWLWFYEWQLKILAALYIFVIHFVIDFSRPYVERVVISRDEFVVTSRKDILMWFWGKSDDRTSRFMRKFFPQWVFVNILDQGSHILSIIIFAWVVSK